ncbi:MAG: GNAT family N-acetyltransferase [Chitinophagia bacterium]|nr:GNAT family N-acetyltransferase [Chitinophagia bacterium]
MPLRIIDHGSREYDQMVALRMDVLRKPLGLSFSPEELEGERADILLGAFDEDHLLACCLLTRQDATTCRLRQMAVVNSLQGRGLGASLLYFAENVARDRGFRELVMHARMTAVGFYEKQGYRTSGQTFEEVTIPHLLMRKPLV